jgi:hypothetical protein
MKILEKLNRLNCWQRIVCAFLIFVYLPIFVFSINEKPFIPSITQTQFLEKVPTDLLNVFKDKKAYFWLNGNENRVGMAEVFLDPDDFITIDYDFGYGWSFILSVNKSIGEATAKALADELGKNINFELNKRYFLARFKIFIFFIIGAVAIYFFGWTICWIKNGFKENRP